MAVHPALSPIEFASVRNEKETIMMGMPSVPTIAVIEDDRKTAELIRLYLVRDGYRVEIAFDGRSGVELVRRVRPSLLVLDLMLPGMDGLDVCRTVRQDYDIPIIMLTAMSTEEDILFGLDLGADDYMTKPFSPRQLAARARAVLRRTADSSAPRPVLRFGALEVDPTAHQARLDGQPLNLTPKEFRLLETMAKEPGRTFRRTELLERVFGFDYDGFDRTVDTHILNLRKKLSLAAHQDNYIHTVHGVGYKFAAHTHAN
jgi:DNA-binding response OmpR family regulator